MAALAVLPLAPAAALPGLDAGFGDGGVATVAEDGAAMALAVQPDGRIVIGAWRRTPSRGALIARLLPDGSPDEGFGTDGAVVIPRSTDEDPVVTSLAVQPDGRIVASVAVHLPAVGRSRLDLIRLTAAGQPDPMFGTEGRVLGPTALNPLGVRATVALQPDGSILLTDAGAPGDPNDWDLMLRRHHANGSPDASFGDRPRLLHGAPLAFGRA